MPVLILIVFLLFPIISAALILWPDWFLDLDVTDKTALIGSIITTAAFCATAWNAYEARKSAKAALKAVKITSDSLIEMRKSSFDQWLKTLIEQTVKLQNKISSKLSSDAGNNITSKFNTDSLPSIFYTVTSEQILIRYIKHIITILEYIDEEFYSPNAAIEMRKFYVEQLRNSIESNIMLIIAIFGLKYSTRLSYNQEKLNYLLNRYVFFENEFFLGSTLLPTKNRELDVQKLFNDDYRSLVRQYIKHRIICNDSRFRNYSKEPEQIDAVRATHAVLWSYKSPLGDMLREKFDSLKSDIEKEFKYYVSVANNELQNSIDKLDVIIGHNLCSKNKLKKRSGIYSIADKSTVITLLNHYIYRIARNINFIKLEDVFFSTMSYPCSDKTGSQLESTIDDYVFYSALLYVNGSSNKDRLFKEIYFEVDKIIADEIAKLNKLA
ncbi:hypothetical protein NCI65_003856 [Escherichia coli]|nr:hypothetical protein [Escherichia coli]HDS0145965.1 hypothetical protein [Escherichia coli]HDS0147437.1 hypothetical protein [Escherichia coli]